MEDTHKYILFTVLFLLIIKNALCVSRIDPLVDTKVGLIRGLRATDGQYSMFMGIPYAYVDEKNVFGQSIPHPGFNDTFEAFDSSAICPQIDAISHLPVGNLDCLHLNIYVPNTATSSNRLPVMVWIHGGGFAGGFSGRDLYGPTYLVRHDVILVTVNYRLGAYGFMCLDTPDVPGNQGLKDQHLALKWVKDNIEAFGGDANKITIFGESAGGVSVDLHLFYSEDNLFNQVIMQSGSALCPWGILESDTSTPLKLAEHLGLKTDDIYEALSFLTTADTKLVIAATGELEILFSPCVEKDFDGVEKFIDDHPINIDLPRVRDIPILAGHNNDEARFALTRDPATWNNLFIDFMTDYFDFDSEEVTKVAELVRHFYAGDGEINEINVEPMIDFDSDFTFNHPIARTIQKHLENGARTIYQYMFSYNGGRNFGKFGMNITQGGAAHADELGYLFNDSYYGDEVSPEDQLIIDRITTLWTNFVKYGNPTPATSDLLPVTWTPVTKDTAFYLNIDSELSIETRPFHDRMAFWDLFYKHYYKAQKGYRDD